MADATSPPTLSYRQDGGWRWKRWVLLAMVALAATAIYCCRKPLAERLRPRWHVAKLHWLERACLTYTPPPGRVVYDDTSGPPASWPPDGEGRYMSLPKYSDFIVLPSGTLCGWVPGPWVQWLEMNERSEHPADVHVDFFLAETYSGGDGVAEQIKSVAFLHERTAIPGQRRLVCVGVSGQDPRLTAFVYAPGSYTHTLTPVLPTTRGEPSQLALHRHLPDDHIRLFAGSPDAVDPSRFTIGGDYHGRPFSIQCQLQGDDEVTFQPTAGWRDANTLGDIPCYVIGGHDDDLVDLAPRWTTWPVADLAAAHEYSCVMRFADHDHGLVLAIDGIALQININDGRVVWRASLPTYSDNLLDLSSDGCSVAIGGQKCGWHIETLPGRRTLLERPADPSPTQLLFTGTGFVMSRGQTVTWWDVARQSPVRRWTGADSILGIATASESRRTGVFTGTAPRSDGPANNDGVTTVTCWTFDRPDNPQPKSFKITYPTGLVPERASAGELSPDGRLIAISLEQNDGLSQDAERIIDVRTGRTIRDGPLPGGPAHDATFSPDGRLLAWCGADAVYAVDVMGRRAYRMIAPGPSEVTFAHDGRTMAAVWSDAVHLWPTPGR